jgi:hypothetical protein
MANPLDGDLDATFWHMEVYVLGSWHQSFAPPTFHHNAAFSIANCGLSSWLP